MAIRINHLQKATQPEDSAHLYLSVTFTSLMLNPPGENMSIHFRLCFKCFSDLKTPLICFLRWLPLQLDRICQPTQTWFPHPNANLLANLPRCKWTLVAEWLSVNPTTPEILWHERYAQIQYFSVPQLWPKSLLPMPRLNCQEVWWPFRVLVQNWAQVNTQLHRSYLCISKHISRRPLQRRLAAGSSLHRSGNYQQESWWLLPAWKDLTSLFRLRRTDVCNLWHAATKTDITSSHDCQSYLKSVHQADRKEQGNTEITEREEDKLALRSGEVCTAKTFFYRSLTMSLGNWSIVEKLLEKRKTLIRDKIWFCWKWLLTAGRRTDDQSLAQAARSRLTDHWVSLTHHKTREDNSPTW